MIYSLIIILILNIAFVVYNIMRLIKMGNTLDRLGKEQNELSQHKEDNYNLWRTKDSTKKS